MSILLYIAGFLLLSSGLRAARINDKKQIIKTANTRTN